jgi:hypothetical protein
VNREDYLEVLSMAMAMSETKLCAKCREASRSTNGAGCYRSNYE